MNSPQGSLVSQRTLVTNARDVPSHSLEERHPRGANEN